MGFIGRVKKSVWVVIGALVLMMTCGYWVGSRALLAELGSSAGPAQAPPSGSAGALFTTRVSGAVARPVKGDPFARDNGAVENERVLLFADQQALDAFLDKHGHQLSVLEVIGPLHALRVRIGSMAEWMESLSQDEGEMLIFPVSIPPLNEGSVQRDAMALGDQLLPWLGVNGAAPDWGAGIRIAILDTGVVPTDRLGKIGQWIELVPSSNDLSMHNGHANAVASVISGQSAETPGVAPAAELISVRVANDAGFSDTFVLARGIVEAVDAGANLINISLGGFGDSPVLRQAVDYALQRGVLVIAAVGNQGLDRVQYPAAIDGVIGVAAVDALGSHLDFSNSGQQVAVAAPGFGVRSQWTDGQLVEVTGTSFSSPIVAGVLAAIMSHGGQEPLSAASAWELMGRYLNDAGSAGVDAQLGAGMPDLGRVIMRDTPGVYDAALASMSLLAADANHPYGQVEILVQNRGTESLLNTTLSIFSGGVSHRVNLTALAPGEVQAIQVPVNQQLTTAGAFAVDSRVVLGNGLIDAKPDNDYRHVSYEAE